MWYIKQDYTAGSGIANIISLFARPWIVMLALGGVGHRMHLPFLYLDYWTVFLGYLATRALIGDIPVTDYKAAMSRKELK
jgi:hypothetical protein